MKTKLCDAGIGREPAGTTTDAISYSVLVYEDRYGLWIKIPEFDMQCLADDLEAGIEVLEERLFFELAERERRGERIPEKTIRSVRIVDHREYGPTEVELERIR